MGPMRLKSWGSNFTVVGSFLIGLWLIGGVHVQTQSPFIVFGSNSGVAQPIKSTSNALWVSVQSGSAASIPFNVNGATLGTTSTDGVVIQNTTAATAGTTVQISPREKLCGAAWNSSSVASETDCWIMEVL